jgi:capsid portal protein
MYKTKGTIKRVGDETSTELGLPLIYVEIEQENKALLTAACLETPMVDQVKKCKQNDVVEIEFTIHSKAGKNNVILQEIKFV